MIDESGVLIPAGRRVSGGGRRVPDGPGDAEFINHGGRVELAFLGGPNEDACDIVGDGDVLRESRPGYGPETTGSTLASPHTHAHAAHAHAHAAEAHAHAAEAHPHAVSHPPHHAHAAETVATT